MLPKGSYIIALEERQAQLLLQGLCNGGLAAAGGTRDDPDVLQLPGLQALRRSLGGMVLQLGLRHGDWSTGEANGRRLEVGGHHGEGAEICWTWTPEGTRSNWT